MSQLLESSQKLRELGVTLLTTKSLENLSDDIRRAFDEPNKIISQLIAQKWLDNAELTASDVSKALKKGGHGDKYDVFIDKKPYTEWQSRLPHAKKPPAMNYEGYWTIPERDEVPIGLYIPFPERPPKTDLTDQALQDWVDQSPSVAPFYPENVWIPYSC